MLQKIAIVDFAPLTLAATRILIAGLFLWAVIRVTRGPVLFEAGQRMPLMPFVLLGLMNQAGPYLLIAWAQLYISSSVAGILMASVPLFTILLAHLFAEDERLIGRRLVGVLIGLGGVVLLIGPDALLDFGQHVMGQLAVVLAAFGYGMTNVYGRRHKARDPMRMATGSTLAAAILMVPIALVMDQPWLLTPSLSGSVALFMIGLTGTGLPTLLFYYLLRSAGATNTSMVSFLVPVVAVISGIAFLGEELTLYSGIAFAVILSALLIINPPQAIWKTTSPQK